MEKQIKRNHSCKHKICRRTRYRNYKFCYLHILDDKSAPFTTCQYISNVTKRKCSNPALKPDRSNSTVPCLCEIHNNAKSQTNRIKYRSHRKKNSKLADRDYQPTLLQKLRKHHKSNDGEAKHNTDDESGQPYDLAMEQLELDTYENRQWVTGLSTSWKSGEADIDVDLVEDLNNPLKYAGAYTAEEVISMSKDRLVRLQSLYIDQFKHLHRTLQEGRRKYLVDKSIEEQQGSSHSSSKQLSSRSEHHHLHELKSLVGFRRRSGEEILLHKKLKKRRLEITKGKTVMPLEAQPHRSRCSHVTKNTRCKSSCLPYTKYCTAHILEDPLQIMYKKCNWKGCTIPVCVMSLEQSKQKAQCFCPAHRKLPEFSQKLEKLVSNIGEANTVIVTDNVSVKEETKEQDVEIAEVLGDILTTVEDGLNIINMETLIEPKEEMVNGIEDDKEEVIPIPPPVVDDTPMILVEEDSMGVEEHQVESHPPMDVDPPEDVDFSKSSSVINSISTGQLFMVSNSPDEGALHLEPLIPSLSSHGHTVSVLPSENNNDSCEKFLREKGYAENAETESRQSVTLEIGDAKQSKSIEAKVQHQGAIISVSNERTKYEKTSKKIVTTTLVPPVETKRETSDKEEHLEE
uniref:KAT8 regulatory NSL complex subunit 2 n=2 Tax=Ciona intestinalis TaxID=7719 RepID=F6YNK9_CIOIN